MAIDRAIVITPARLLEVVGCDKVHVGMAVTGTCSNKLKDFISNSLNVGTESTSTFIMSVPISRPSKTTFDQVAIALMRFESPKTLDKSSSEALSTATRY